MQTIDIKKVSIKVVRVEFSEIMALIERALGCETNPKKVWSFREGKYNKPDYKISSPHYLILEIKGD